MSLLYKGIKFLDCYIAVIRCVTPVYCVFLHRLILFAALSIDSLLLLVNFILCLPSIFGCIVQLCIENRSYFSGTSGIWGLKKNFALLELLERLQLCYEKEAATFLRCTEALEKEPSVSVSVYD